MAHLTLAPDVLDTVQRALALMHEASKDFGVPDAEETQAQVQAAWTAMGFAGHPWEH